MSLSRCDIPLVLCVTLATFACGRQETAPTAASPATALGPDESATWSLAVNSASDLPACSAGTEGRLAFIKTTNKFMACNQGSWGAIDLKNVVGSGTNGTNGANGTNGVDGSNGKNSLVKVVAEPNGSNCASGGKKVLTGMDANSDNVLNEIEVTGTAYVCHGEDGADGLAVASTWKYNYSGSLTSGAPEIVIGQTAGWYVWLTDVEVQKFTNGGAFVSAAGIRFSHTFNDDLYDENFSQSFFLPPSTSNQIVVRKFGTVINTLFQFQVQLTPTPVFKAVIVAGGTPLVSVKTFPLSQQ